MSMESEKKRPSGARRIFWIFCMIDMVLQKQFSFKFLACFFSYFILRERRYCITEQGWKCLFRCQWILVERGVSLASAILVRLLDIL